MRESWVICTSSEASPRRVRDVLRALWKAFTYCAATALSMASCVVNAAIPRLPAERRPAGSGIPHRPKEREYGRARARSEPSHRANRDRQIAGDEGFAFVHRLRRIAKELLERADDHVAVDRADL